VTAIDMANALFTEHRLRVSRSTIYRCLHELGYSVKVAQRSRCHQALQLSHPFFAHSDPYSGDAISIDETSFCSSDRPRKGWGLKGVRVPKRRPGNRRRLSLILAIGHEGVVGYRTVSGSVKGSVFADFVRELPDGRPLIIDNASIHKTRCVKNACIGKSIEIRHTPPYSPWYNPVESTFSWMKRRFRHMQCVDEVRAATVQDGIEKVVRSVPDVTPYFQHCARVWAEDAAMVRDAVCARTDANTT
jgi:transposase